MPSASKLVKKEAYDAKLCDALASHTKAILVHADNVGSLQFANIRKVRRLGGPSAPAAGPPRRPAGRNLQPNPYCLARPPRRAA